MKWPGLLKTEQQPVGDVKEHEEEGKEERRRVKSDGELLVQAEDGERENAQRPEPAYYIKEPRNQ